MSYPIPFKLGDLNEGESTKVQVISSTPSVEESQYGLLDVYHLRHEGQEKVLKLGGKKAKAIKDLLLSDGDNLVINRDRGSKYPSFKFGKIKEDQSVPSQVQQLAKENYVSKYANIDGMRWDCCLHVASRNHAGKEVDPQVIIAEARKYYLADPNNQETEQPKKQQEISIENLPF